MKTESSLGKRLASFELVMQPSKRMLCAHWRGFSPVTKPETTTPRHLQLPFPCFLF